jgi:hypothetical protein
MRDPSRTWRKPQQRLNITAVRERIAAARERLETGATKVLLPPESHGPLEVLDVCCQALETALLLHAFDSEGCLDVVAESLVLLQAERGCRRRGE